MKRVVLVGILLATVASGPGCSLAPKSFRDMIHPAPIVRARALGLDDKQPEWVAVPAMIERLNDPDKVVRMAANDGLKERTRRDFGFVPWAPPEERAKAVAAVEGLVGRPAGPSRLSKRREFDLKSRTDPPGADGTVPEGTREGRPHHGQPRRRPNLIPDPVRRGGSLNPLRAAHGLVGYLGRAGPADDLGAIGGAPARRVGPAVPDPSRSASSTA